MSTASLATRVSDERAAQILRVSVAELRERKEDDVRSPERCVRATRRVLHLDDGQVVAVLDAEWAALGHHVDPLPVPWGNASLAHVASPAAAAQPAKRKRRQLSAAQRKRISEAARK